MNRIRSAFVAILVSLLGSAACLAGSSKEPGSWGINVQTLYHESALKSLGTQWVRLAFTWQKIENDSAGHYDWAESDKMVNYYLNNGFHVLGLLNDEKLNPLYTANIANKQAVVQAISRWMGAVAQRYKGKGIVWELGNEPEAFSMGGYWDHPITYSEKAKRATAAIKQADPLAKVAVLSLAWMDRKFVSGALNAGLLSDGNIDYISFHGYHRKGIEPESGLEDDVNWLRTQIAAATPTGKTAPVVIDSETGYSIIPFETPKTKSGWRLSVYTEDAQAAYLARHYLEEIYLGVPISIWYKDMYGETQYSLYYADENGPQGLRPMGRMFRNLAPLLPDSPASMKNDRYPISIAPTSGNSGSPSGAQLHQRSYFRMNSGGQPTLLIAAWNAVESFDGKILASRTFTENQVIEKWRDVSASDAVSVPAKIQIKGLVSSAIMSAQVLTFQHGEVAQASVTISAAGDSSSSLASLNVTATPTPVIVSIALRGAPQPPTDIRLSN